MKDAWQEFVKDIEIPDCYGQFHCPDDCMVSCPFWEDCMHEGDEDEYDDHDDFPDERYWE